MIFIAYYVSRKVAMKFLNSFETAICFLKISFIGNQFLITFDFYLIL